MTKEELKPGALVRLRSGGPEMVYEGESWLGEALCVWFQGAKKMTEPFGFEVLERVR